MSSRQPSRWLDRLTRPLGDRVRSLFVAGGLRRRILLLGLAELTLAVAVLGALGVWAVGDSVERTLQERLSLGRAIASHLDHILADDQQFLQTAARSDGLDFSDGNDGPERRAMSAAYQSGRFRRVYLFDSSGRVVWTEPSGSAQSGPALPATSAIQSGLAAGLPAVTGGYSLDDAGRPVVSIAARVEGPAGELVGVVLGDLNLPDARFQQIIQPVGLGATARVDVVDASGVVLASTGEAYLFQNSDHRSQLAELIKSGRSTVGACHSCHEAAPNVPEAAVMALAPLNTASWAVVVREAESEAFAPAERLKQQIAFVALPLLLVSIAVAWRVGRGIAGSVDDLAQAAERITGGDLDSPVPARGDDEVGRLGRTLDSMRDRLRSSRERERALNADLERRVLARTEELGQSERALRQRNAELLSLNKEVQRKDVELTALLRRLIAVQEEERRRIARDMHDETSQTLAAVLVAIETAEAVTGTEEATRQLATARRLAERALGDVHKLIFDLRPSLLDDLGLVAAVRWYAETRLEAVGVAVRFEVDGESSRLAPEVETCVYRIAQESIANVARHAGAENALVRLEFGETALRVDVEDDGRGFDPERTARQQPRSDGGFGLVGMRERAGLIGGTIEVHSRPGQGTTVRLRLPLAAPSAAPPAESDDAKGEQEASGE